MGYKDIIKISPTMVLWESNVRLKARTNPWPRVKGHPMKTVHSDIAL